MQHRGRKWMYLAIVISSFTFGFFLTHRPADALSLGGDLGIKGGKGGGAERCPGGDIPKCTVCRGNKCDWACRGGYTCFGVEGKSCTLKGASCGAELTVIGTIGGGFFSGF
jgi:hypothetical protein